MVCRYCCRAQVEWTSTYVLTSPSLMNAFIESDINYHLSKNLCPNFGVQRSSQNWMQIQVSGRSHFTRTLSISLPFSLHFDNIVLTSFLSQLHLPCNTFSILSPPFCKTFFFVLASSQEEHDQHLATVLDRRREANVTLASMARTHE